MKAKVLQVAATVLCIATGIAASSKIEKDADPVVWNQVAAASYLDRREIWWQGWPKAERDQGTVCISCHTVVPYALSRPSLRPAMKESGLSAPEQKMLGDVTKRVNLWSQVSPFYDDPAPGSLRGISARGTEAVLNALILNSYDAPRGVLSSTARKALDAAWALQLKTGDEAGGWIWLNFHNAPWEGEESPYQGASFAALAVGLTPQEYRKEPDVKMHIDLLRSYLQRHYATQPLANQLVLLWASAKLSGLLAPAEQRNLVERVFAQQQADGGWSLSTLGTWKRRDATPLETRSDGYATGLAILAMHANGLAADDPRVAKALLWLSKNQDATEGSWPAYSLNKKRDPASDIGRFMTDAATAYASMALAESAR